MAALMQLRGRRAILPIFCCQRLQICYGRTFSISQSRNNVTEEHGSATKDVQGQRKKLFSEMMNERREEAFNSILVRLGDEGMDKSLLNYCSQHGKVRNSFTYTGEGKYAVVQYEDSSGVQELLKKAKPPKSQSKMPFRSRLLNFSGSSGSGGKKKSGKKTENSGKDLQSNFLRKLCAAESVGDQMMILLREQEMPLEDIHLRFLVCSLVEEAVDKIVPDCIVYPFGSSANSFGKVGTDVDMYLDITSENGVIPRKIGKNRFQMVFDTKSAASERAATQQTLATMATYLRDFVPHCVNVYKILEARCPIVKFYHQATGLQCDLSSNNRIATKSTELLYLYGNHDPRVRPLVYTLRHWARINGITSSSPGPWITNFGFTLLVIYFLQTRDNPVVPTVDFLQYLAAKGDRLKIDGVDCSFVSDLNKVPPSKNNQPLGELLYELFEFYSKFDFQRYALSLRRGQHFKKLEIGHPLHIENPFETELNVTRNVSQDHLHRLVTRMQEALWVIDREGSQTNNVDEQKDNNEFHAWGLASLLTNIKPTKKRGWRSTSLLLNEYLSPIFQSLEVTKPKTNVSNGQMKLISKKNKLKIAIAIGAALAATGTYYSVIKGKLNYLQLEVNMSLILKLQLVSSVSLTK
ncbi:poly(A) RNA polymerase, mitochondrial-like [Glandiceps talaboti]